MSQHCFFWHPQTWESIVVDADTFPYNKTHPSVTDRPFGDAEFIEMPAKSGLPNDPRLVQLMGMFYFRRKRSAGS